MKAQLSYMTIFGVAFLVGCASSPERYAAQSTMELCVDYLTLPSANINQSARARELWYRSEDCSSYQAAASSKNQANANFGAAMDALIQIGASQTRQTFQPQYEQGTHTYNINGKFVTCTTSGTYTRCN